MADVGVPSSPAASPLFEVLDIETMMYFPQFLAGCSGTADRAALRGCDTLSGGAWSYGGAAASLRPEVPSMSLQSLRDERRLSASCSCSKTTSAGACRDELGSEEESVLHGRVKPPLVLVLPVGVETSPQEYGEKVLLSFNDALDAAVKTPPQDVDQSSGGVCLPWKSHSRDGKCFQYEGTRKL